MTVPLDMNKAIQHTRFIKEWAADLGFDHCGIAASEPLDEDARRLEAWLNKGMQGSMHYMENHFDLRINPGKLVPGARSVITLLLNHYPSQLQSLLLPQVAKYAYGTDYHFVIREKLNVLMNRIRETIGEVNGRGFVDSAPVLERTWAQKSGLGWVGKNGNLIHKQSGSYFFIATLITDLELQYDDPMAKDYCGTCTKCIEACPTEAIGADKVVDGSKCVSYFTIELKNMLIPEKMKGRFENWIFGCDTCQDVCPWNRFSKPATEAGFRPIEPVMNFTRSDWMDLTEESFKKLFLHSPLKRAKFDGIRRNLNFIASTHEPEH